jgi:hypothetical protein
VSGPDHNANGQHWPDEPPVLLDAVQWMALGLALASQSFADLLHRDVGPNAFEDGSAQREMYELVMILSAQVASDETGAAATYGKVMSLLGLKRKKGEKLSATLARTLASEARREWSLRSDRSPFAQARRQAEAIRKATAKLLELARPDGPAQQRVDGWNHQERQRKEARAKAARQLTT